MLKIRESQIQKDAKFTASYIKGKGREASSANALNSTVRCVSESNGVDWVARFCLLRFGRTRLVASFFTKSNAGELLPLELLNVAVE